jgi:uncharacterized membrane protein
MPTEPDSAHLPNQDQTQGSTPHPTVDGEDLRTILHAQWSGPLPPPSQLLQYDKAHPGLAERIVVVFEKQFEHRHAVELQAMRNEREESLLAFSQRRRGQYLAFAICLAAILGGTYVGSRGEQIVGSIIGGTGLAGLAAAFIYGQATGGKKEQP